MEEYVLIVPEELDCIIEGSACYDKARRLTYFELDEEKIGELEIFKVKGFPHLVVVDKFNRIDFAGIRCSRIERYFDYEGARDRLYQARVNGHRLDEAMATYERQADATGDTNYKYRMRRVLDREAIRTEIRQGLLNIMDSYNGREFEVRLLSERCFKFIWFWEMGSVKLDESSKEFFTQEEFMIPSVSVVKDFITNRLPQKLMPLAQKVCLETVLYYMATESRIFDRYEDIHQNQRFRLYVTIADSSIINPPLIHDYSSQPQQEFEAKPDFSKAEFVEEDMREFDFSGKNLTGVVFERCNLRRARFHGSILDEAKFVECNLIGADFTGASLINSSFSESRLNQACFDHANLHSAEFVGSDLFHTRFIKSDLTGAKIKSIKLKMAYFYWAKMLGMVFEIDEFIDGCVFRLCDLRGARFIVTDSFTGLMNECDYNMSNLIESQFVINLIAETKFTKANLNAADLSGCQEISNTDFRWSRCFDLNLEGTSIEECNFSFVDLSKLKVKTNISFIKNNFSHTNLSRFDFTAKVYLSPNYLNNTNLTGCNLEGADLSTGYIRMVDFKDAKLKGAIFKMEQLEYTNIASFQQREIICVDEEVEIEKSS